MDYPCAKFDDFSYSRFGLRTDRHTESQTRMIAILTRLSSELIIIIIIIIIIIVYNCLQLQTRRIMAPKPLEGREKFYIG